MVALRAALIGLLVAGCYSPSIEECTITCGAGSACPVDTTCGSDGFCHADPTVSCEQVDGRVDAPMVDARPAPDAIDARIVDAAPVPDGRIVDGGRDAPLPPDARVPDARIFDARVPDAPPDAGMPPPCTDELTAIEETDAEDARFSNLSVTKDGHVHVTFIDDITQRLRYAHRLPGATAWQFETIDEGAANQLKGQVLDSSGVLHVAYTGAGATLMYAVRDPQLGWLTDVIDDAGTARDATIAIDARGFVHVAYLFNNNDLNHALQLVREGEWFITPIDTVGTAGQHASLDIGPDGALHVSYRIFDARLDLGYATLPPLATAWTTTRPDQTGNVGTFTSLDVDGAGNVHISYGDPSNLSLKYALLLATGGEPRIIFADEDLQVGDFTSLAVGTNGTVHISYYDYGNFDLKYATRRSNQPQFTAVTLDGDFGADVGENSSLALDGFNGVHIAYIDSDFDDLRYAHICPR